MSFAFCALNLIYFYTRDDDENIYRKKAGDNSVSGIMHRVYSILFIDIFISVSNPKEVQGVKDEEIFLNFIN
jgi:hypothetical protein